PASSFLHGWHHVAQKSTSTTLPRRSAEESGCPCRSVTEKSGRLEPTAPAAIRVSSDGAGLACCRLHPASPPMAKLKNNRYRFSIYSFFWTSRMRSFSGFDGSAFFLPAGFLYSCPRTVTSICEPASDSRLFDNSFAAIAKD